MLSFRLRLHGLPFPLEESNELRSGFLSQSMYFSLLWCAAFHFRSDHLEFSLNLLFCGGQTQSKEETQKKFFEKFFSEKELLTEKENREREKG